ncbi:class I SAM-dependent methyltransferase [Pseudolysobacter antarcticus]|uniref:Class I SAM-dependent methyltransferase n=2 Tax=Pseudolysobacter antarcticus TaxID=2511995 RepID=A0A411HNE4_9GAMM|nr:class I SAM-dependent methyltransferase [Pseudolysobacter antarcticus]
MMRVLARLRSGLAALQWRDFALAYARCPFCGPSIFVRINRDETGVRCLRCAASAVHIAMGWALSAQCLDLAQSDACEFSARGPLVAYLQRCARSLKVSEYFADLASGQMRDGVYFEDMQRLSYADASFDLITHTEVLEHVPDDTLALAELHRVLRPGGYLLFTVPLFDSENTVERAYLRDGAIEHLLAPSYHRDPLRGGEGILAFRDYGRDILARLRAVGFAAPSLYVAPQKIPWISHSRIVVIAQK